MPGRSALAVGLIALALAFLAFMNARVGVGLMVMPDTRFGPGFDLFRPQMAALQVRQARPGFRDQKAVSRLAAASLEQAPLNVRALRMLAIDDDLAGNKQAAAAKMVMIDRLSRREGVAQLWLADFKGRDGNVEGALHHMDIMLRTMPQATDPLLERMALAIQLPEARKAIRPFMKASTPWIERFFYITLQKASNAKSLGELVASLDRAPDVDGIGNSYRTLVYHLASQGHYDVLLDAYPKIPRGNKGDLYDVSLASAGSNSGYGPAIWDFGSRSDRGGALLKPDEAEFFAIGDVRGVAASKVVYFKSGAPRQLLFRKLEGEPGDQSQAFWRVSCVFGEAKGRVVQSVNLLEMPNNTQGKLPIPQNCAAATMELMVDGGTRRSPTRVVLSDVRLDS
jgi:hypothetical protein